MNAPDVTPADVPGIELTSTNNVWGPGMHRHTYETNPPLLDDKGRRIGWFVYLAERPGPHGVSFSVTLQPTRAGKRFGPGSTPTAPYDGARDATREVERLLRQALKRYRKVFAPKS